MPGKGDMYTYWCVTVLKFITYYLYSERPKSGLVRILKSTCLRFVGVQISDSCLNTELKNVSNQRDKYIDCFRFVLVWTAFSV